MPPKFDVERIRADFPMLQKEMNGRPLIYLDSAATAQKPKCVIDALSHFYTEEYGTVHRGVYELSVRATEHYSQVRCQVKDFLNAESEEEIVYTRGTTDAINLVASSFGKRFVEPGDEILISAMEHHSNIVPWQLLCKERGAHLKIIPMDDNGELYLDEYEKLLSKKTKLVSIAHIANFTGTLNPIKEMAKLAHERGAKIFVDGAQSAPHMPIDVQDLDVDFYAFSGHKLYGPTGIGILYGKKELLEELPPYQGGGDMVDQVTFEETIYQKPPLKFEAGTPMIAQVMGLGAAISYLENLGMEAICSWTDRLLHYAREKLETMNHIRILSKAKKTRSASHICHGRNTRARPWNPSRTQRCCHPHRPSLRSAITPPL